MMDRAEGTDAQIIYIGCSNHFATTSCGRFDVGKMAPMCQKYLWRGTVRLTKH